MSLNIEQRPARPPVAVLIPCYNEEVTIARVVRGFRAAVTDAKVFVYDNNSSDGTGARRAQKLMRFLDIPSPAARHER
jgi:glycosyltransferase involved in cell wall biosynthesis